MVPSSHHKGEVDVAAVPHFSKQNTRALQGLKSAALLLTQAGTAAERCVAILDTNNDLYLLKPLATGITNGSSVTGPSGKPVAVHGNQQQTNGLVKLASNVSSPPMWHDSAPLLAAVVDGQLVVWYNPAVACVDGDLLRATRRTHGDG